MTLTRQSPSRSPCEEASALASYFLGGFECSTKVRVDGRRLDLLASTGHDRWATEDYRRLRQHGLAAARDGMRWHLIETTRGRYDWSSFRPMLAAATATSVQVIWDLCHYGWPDWLDIWSTTFVEAFARFAAEAARVIQEESEDPPFLCLINELSYWAWAGGEVGRIGPCGRGRGDDLKRQLVRASIAATHAVRAVAPKARFLHAEPLIHVAPASSDEADLWAAERYRLGQYQALDMLAGRLAPELGGSAACLDLVGVNFYPDNQWIHGGGTIPLGHHAFRPLRDMLAEIHERFGRPLIIAETGAESTARPAWLHYVASEVAAARRGGTRVDGICLYPILDYPGWDNDRLCAVGLFSAADAHGRRAADPDLAAELRRQSSIAPERSDVLRLREAFA